MLRESEPESVSGSTKSRGVRIPRGEIDFTKNRIMLARLLWPRKTAAHLAAEAGCSERQAKFYLAGREWSHEAIMVVVSKVL